MRLFGCATGEDGGIKMGPLELRSTDARFSNAWIRAATPSPTDFLGGSIGRDPLAVGGDVDDEDKLRSASGFQGRRVCSLSGLGDSVMGISNDCDRTG